MKFQNILIGAGMGLASLCAQALQITSLSPQGEVAQVRQVVAKFDGAAVRFGDAQAPAPLTVQCSDAQASAGSGRWTSEREWVFDFASDLPPGVRCTVQAKMGFKSASGAALAGAASYSFNSGGPFVQQVLPGTWQDIDEAQYFVLQLSGPATLESVQKHVWCAAEGVGERVPVRLVTGDERAALLKGQGLDKRAAQSPLSFATLACNRRLTPATQVQLVWGQGVATPSGVANNVEKRFTFTVRAPFSAEFSCERENAQAACLPIRPLRLSFNAPVERKLAAAIRLRQGKQRMAPQVGDGGAQEDPDSLVEGVQFAPPLDASSAFVLELPKGFQDAAGRPLANADAFPMQVATGSMPPLAKFAAAPFGIVERFAEGPEGPALLPVTLRNVEAALRVQGLPVGPAGATSAAPAPASKVRTLAPSADQDIIAWYRKVQAYNGWGVDRKRARRDTQGPLPPVLPEGDKDHVEARMLSLLNKQGAAKALDLPKPASNDPRPFEVVGIPLASGFHVVEIASPLLGSALLDAQYGAQRSMYVRTTALVTNLGVHFKLGRENALAWVTTLDKGQPVAGARVVVSDCRGKALAQATTDAQGRAQFNGLSPEVPNCHDDGGGSEGYFVSARSAGLGGEQDMAFVWSDWQRGIEPWRFNVPTSSSAEPDERAHTVLDRTLVRAGETVSMKHLLRLETAQGLALPAHEPTRLLITHVGSGQQFEQPLAWRKTATGGRSAHSRFAVPPAARLGVYQVTLQGAGNGRSFESGQFRVEEFRLPVLQGRVHPLQDKALVNVRAVPVGVQVNYVAGGAAAQLPVRVSALVQARSLDFAGYEAFSFAPARGRRQTTSEGEEEASASQDARVVADKLALTLDRQGQGQTTIENLPRTAGAQELLVEATYADPSGEVQTLRSTSALWPAAVVAGIKAEGWVSSRQKARFQALALTTDGKPAANVPLQVQAIARTTTTSRKRMVGGFYSYDNHTDTKDLGTVCTGKSDSRGLLLCEALLDEPGEVELVVTARDKDGNTFDAAASVWVTQHGELWFGGENHDRMDLLPEKKSYQPGETARFQVRMPFRFATALVAVEREGILETQVVQLNGQDPTVELKVQDSWGPNVYVSVLALRGRLREVPWYSFFTWGYQAPRAWWTAFWFEGKEYVAPTALVDLAKPAFRLGLAEIQVGKQAHQINVQVTADKPSYPVRGQAQVTIRATLPNGKPAAHAEVALAAVDQALLELMPNTSWNLLDAMLARRSWGVATSTAQMEIIGRRHYGRKAVPAGGGGGRAPTRELLDTLLLWQPALQLDAKGQAQVTIPLNDALTTFQIVAVADAGVGLFGTGSTQIRSAQDLQIISGLPPLVRDGDQFRAQITLRNTTKAAMQVEVAPRATLLELQPQTVAIPAGEARELAWNVTAPAQLAQTRFETLLWEIDAKDSASGARDALKARQRIVPAVPLTVQQATLVQVDERFALAVQAPAGALAANGALRGGLQMSLQPKLAEGLPGVRDWWARYPFTCLEQQTSKAVGLNDGALWQQLMAQLPTYLDGDGLAHYFPPQGGDAHRGSDTLTAHLLASAHEAARLNPAFALPDAVLAPMERGLSDFVEGRIQRDFWSPRADLDVRKLAAIEALSRYGKAAPRMLDSITLAPNQWPTHAVIDWFNILKRLPAVPQRAQRLQEAQQILKGRLSYQGTRLIFSTEQDDHWWWLMQGGDVNTARLLLAVLDEPAWQGDLARLVSGFIARQQGGAWQTTTANLWGGLALQRFSAQFEATPVAGSTQATLGERSASVDWAQVARIQTQDASGAVHQTSTFGAPAAPGQLKNNRMFLPWDAGSGALQVLHQGAGKPWLTLQSLAAVPLQAPLDAGYRIRRSVTPIEQADKSLPPGQYSRGDVLRVALEVTASAPMTWVAITDPIPAGATILGSGLGRDSQMAARGEKRSGAGWPAFEERSFEAFRSYYEYLPKGTVTMEYTMRLNNAGDFALPPSRVEALYAPEMFGAAPNARVQVRAMPKGVGQ